MIVQLPSPQDLALRIEKLEGHPASLVLIANRTTGRLQLRNVHSRVVVAGGAQSFESRAGKSTEETRAFAPGSPW
jgi:hypothetical protein